MQITLVTSTTRARVGIWVAALVLTACGGASEAPTVAKQTLLSDADGAISDWLLQLSDDSPREFIQTQAALVAATPRDVLFRVSYGDAPTRDAFLKALRQRGVGIQERVTAVRTSGFHYVWLRDLYVAGVDPSGAPLALMHHPDHLASVRGAPSHTQTLGTVQTLGAGRLVETMLRLEGGSVVSDSERAFLSRKSAAIALRSGQFENLDAFRRHVEEQWSRPLTLVSTAWADRAEHLDLLMMPIGGRRVIVSSPQLALRLIEHMPEREAARFNQEALAVATRAPRSDPLRYLQRVDSLNALEVETAEPRRMAAFEKLRGELTAVGYDLVDVPFLSLDPERNGARVVLSYTNVLQDVRGGVRTVYMPTYRLPTFDDRAARAWKRCGYRVVRVDAFGPGLNGGALRCLSQVIRRAGKPATGSGRPVDQEGRP